MMKVILSVAFLSVIPSVIGLPGFLFFGNDDQPKSHNFPYTLRRNDAFDVGTTKLAGRVCEPLFTGRRIHTYGEALKDDNQNSYRAGIKFLMNPTGGNKFGQSIKKEGGCASCFEVRADGDKMIRIFVVDTTYKGKNDVEVGKAAFEKLGGKEGDAVNVAVKKVEDYLCS